MGGYLSTSSTSSSGNMNAETTAALPYICAKIDGNLTVDPNVILEVKPSTLPSGFLEGRHLGVYTKHAISKGTLIMKMDMGTESKMNDAAVDLEPILRADTSEKMYQAWTEMMRTYYDLEKLKRMTNVRMVTNGSGACYEAIQDIPADGELVRVYGFTTWVLELFEIFTNKNIVGFAHFIDDLSKNMQGDPYEGRIARLHLVLEKCGIENIYAQDRIAYDASMKDKSLTYVGDHLKELYLAESPTPLVYDLLK